MVAPARTLLGGRYELGDLLGRGGMASVHRGMDHVLGRPVAIKILAPGLSGDPAAVERFRREAQAAAGLSHPGIVTVFDTGSDGDLHYIVMELVEGRSLAAILAERGRLRPEVAATVAARVADALAYAHAAGVVHRDVKPGNIMVTKGRVKVMDFGIARVLSSHTLTETAAILGTASYLAPEQAEGRGVDARTDVYALGVVLYQLLTGRPPFVGDSPVAVAVKHVGEAPAPPSEVAPGVPAALEAEVLRALAKDPDERHDSAAELARRLDAIRSALLAGTAHSDSAEAVRGEEGSEAEGPPRRRWARLGALAAILMAGLVTIGFVLPAPSTTTDPGREAPLERADRAEEGPEGQGTAEAEVAGAGTSSEPSGGDPTRRGPNRQADEQPLGSDEPGPQLRSGDKEVADEPDPEPSAEPTEEPTPVPSPPVPSPTETAGSGDKGEASLP